MDEPFDLPPGLYETIIDAGLEAALHKYRQRVVSEAIDNADFPYVISRYVAERFENSLLKTKGERERFLLTDRVLEVINGGNSADKPIALKDGRAQLLTEIKVFDNSVKTVRPDTPLTDAALLTNAEYDPSIQTELKKEFRSADRVDALIAFIKWTGIRTIAEELAYLKARGVPIRIITTTYMGATDRRALDRLVRDYGAQIKINYNTKSTRLHAKAWLIHRNTGYHTAFVGSSNLSAAAMQDGLEWNVRLAKNNTPAVFEKFETTFDSYWASPSFEIYDPDRDAAKLDRALQDGRGFEQKSDAEIDFTALDIRPYPYQQIMLDDLEYERAMGCHKNLVVAATGTGKTVVAALDYKALRERMASELGRPPRTLFVAHRNEILNQSMRTFRDVVKSRQIIWSTSDGYSLAQLNDATLNRYDNIAFASIQSLRPDVLNEIPRDFFDIIIIDEFHHAQAASYQRLMRHFNARELVGLTATPERGDGVNVALEFFNGRVASELRLWDALEEGLLCPFHYFIQYDDTDLSGVKMVRGDYVTSELSNVLTGNDARVRQIVQAMRDKILDLEGMRALCFCVDIDHAKYMARSFRKFGLKAEYVTSAESSMERDKALGALASGQIQIICSVDIFNEGVDVPSVDTVLMLRPTQSPTVFLQQLGRGLRLSNNKTVLTVLDFVGNQNEAFRFDLKLQVLTGTSRKNLMAAVEKGFSHLPAGSQIFLEEKSQKVVLQSIKNNLNVSTQKLPAEIRNAALAARVDAQDYQLTDYLKDSHRDIADIYSRKDFRKRPISWKRLLHVAATGSDLAADAYEDVRRRLRAFAHVSDPERIEIYLKILSTPHYRYEAMTAREKFYAHMLMYSFWPSGKRDEKKIASIDYALQVLRSTPDLVDELRQIFVAVSDRTKKLYQQPAGEMGLWSPLKVGAVYTREELLAGIGVGYEFQGQAPGGVREGVKYCEYTNTEALLVTLVKSEADYSPNTLYRDFALTPTLFHWESQSSAGPHTKAGMRYLEGESNIALFIREHKKDALGEGAAYTFAGPAHLVEAKGARPMQITWELDHSLPPDLYMSARAVAS